MALDPTVTFLHGKHSLPGILGSGESLDFNILYQGLKLDRFKTVVKPDLSDGYRLLVDLYFCAHDGRIVVVDW